MTATTTELPGTGPYQRFIVKFREGSVPAGDREAVPDRLEGAAAAAGLMSRDGAAPLRLAWLRRLGVGADVLEAERPLDRAEARRLLQALGADPDVEYAEVDQIMEIGPGGIIRGD